MEDSLGESLNGADAPERETSVETRWEPAAGFLQLFFDDVPSTFARFAFMPRYRKRWQADRTPERCGAE
jgi:hypothetical protein